MSQSAFRSDIFCPQDGNPREQINGITAFIDGSNIYGSTEEVAMGLRVDETFGTETFPGARLRTQISRHTTPRGHEALPSRRQCRFASPQPTPENRNPNPTGADLTSGDTRAVVQPTLTSMHTLFLQEHNRIVDAVTKFWETSTVTKNLSPRTKADFIFEVSSFFIVCMSLPNFWKLKLFQSDMTLKDSPSLPGDWLELNFSRSPTESSSLLLLVRRLLATLPALRQPMIRM